MSVGGQTQKNVFNNKNITHETIKKLPKNGIKNCKRLYTINNKKIHKFMRKSRTFRQSVTVAEIGIVRPYANTRMQI